MATTKDVSAQSDIGKMNVRGAFNRAPSSFRNFIEKGGKFEPEKGVGIPTWQTWHLHSHTR